MAINSNIHLSTASKIENDVQRTVEDFSTVGTMGSLINNANFKQGYDEFALGQTTERSYIWKALSAVSEQLGQTLYQNVKDYIDNVSNVDVCKVKALKSMMYLLGSDYNVLDKVGYYPIEIQNLIDILSINKKYLLSNKYIKQDFLDALCADRIVSCITPEQQLYGPYYTSAVMLSDESILSIEAVSSSTDFYRLSTDEVFDAYLSSVFGNFIYDMLEMHGTGLCSNTMLYKTGFLSSVYGPDAVYEDKYALKKKILNVDINFNVEQVVNDIDVGADSIDNYFGNELSLLNEEIEYRKSPDKSLSCLDLATRNIYYRKQKVVEYAEFVDNMVFLPVNFSSYVEYQYDKDYLTMLSGSQHKTCITDLSSNPHIVDSYVQYAAVALVEITKYIAKIRETIKLQARKIFMKGTNNLLMYTANEFVIDYINSLKSVMPYNKISAFVEKLSAHSIKDVEVQEYWDLTEYMNLSTVTTRYAMNRSLVNDRFFDQTFNRVNDQLIPDANNVFTNEELNHFYLDNLNLANTLYPAHSSSRLVSDLSSNLYEFLSVLFDIGANTSYYNEQSKFGMKLPNDVITEEINNDLLSTKYISSFLDDAMMSTGYEFDGSQSIEKQIDDFSQAIYDTVQQAAREGISSTYDTYSGQMSEISGMLDALKSDFNTLVEDTYASYFCKSTSIYCYYPDGTYMFDFYVGNMKYANDNSYELSSQSARDWINDDNCYTFALSTIIEQLSASYDRCYSQLTSIVHDYLEPLDFINPDSADLAVDMDSMQQFVNTKIQQRNTYLQNMLQDVKSQAAQAKQEHESIQTTFSSVLASLPNLPHQDFYMQGCGVDGDGQLTGTHRLIDPVKKDDLKGSIYDAVSQARYKESTKHGTFLYVPCNQYLDEMFVINENDSLETSINTGIQLVDFVNTISFGASTSTIRTTGTQKMTLQSLQTGIERIKTLTLPSIVDQVNSVFNLDIDKNELFSNKSCAEQIDSLISYLNVNVSEQQFNGDSVIQNYYQILSQINDISCNEYISSKQQYDAIWTEFASFFTDYNKGSEYTLFIPSNLHSINEYRQKKDLLALQRINESLDSFDDRYAQMLKQFIDICNDNYILLYGSDMKQHRYLYNGNALEYSIDDFNEKLMIDIEMKDIIANLNAEKVVNELHNCVNMSYKLYQKYFPNAIKYVDWVDFIEQFNNLSVQYTSLLFGIIEKLEYNDEYEYVYSKDFFKNYSGLTSIATDPYYNIKNQTHPSYQIHPFMWNFIEYYPINNILNSISKSIVSLNFDLLESSKALSAIDTMLGAFGNVIDVWRNNILDFTGYSTKYEQSNHICEYTGRWSEVVGYEGAFYPPAVNLYMSSSRSTVESLDKYYRHLNLDADPVMKSRINKALSSDYESVRNIANNPRTKANIDDIYKYYTDAYENEYILYKNYSNDNPTEQEKREKTGQLWIRLADSPIAFKYSKIIDVDETSNSFVNLANNICDICILDTGTKIVLTGVNSSTQLQSQTFYIKYDVKHLCGVGHLSFMTYNPNGQYGSQGKQSTPVPDIENGKHYKYLGSLDSDSNEADIVYVECDADGKIPDDPNVHVWLVKQEYAELTHFTYKVNGIHGIIETPVVSYHESGSGSSNVRYVDVMFASKSSSQCMTSQHKGLTVGTVNDAEGAIFNNISRQQMNSLDLFEDRLTFASIAIEKNSGDLDNYQESSTHPALQINTDMGYIPSYTYGKYENVLDIAHEFDSSYQMVELLGKSKDIESIAAKVNEDPDPYVTKQMLFDKYMYGRIYEDDGIMRIPGDEKSVSSFSDYPAISDDYANPPQFDDSINIYSNWSMYQSMPSERRDDYYMNYVNGHYQWTIFLNSKYSYEKLRKLRLFIFSTTSLGRNPYVVADMSDVIDLSEQLEENYFLSTNYNSSQFDTTTYSFTTGMFTVQVNGTSNGINQVDSQFSNALPNVRNIEYKYSTLPGGAMYMKLDFELNDVNAYGYIAEDTVKVALVDMFDLSFYNWCHFLDPGVTFGDYQYIINKLSGTPLTKEQLLSIDFSQYNYLSDIQVNGMQIFSTNRRLQFKVDEADVFGISSFNYYVPCLNTKYPLTFAQAFDELYNSPDDQLRHMVRLYEPDEVFDLHVVDASIMSSLHILDMEYSDISDDFRVYEDYYDTHVDGVDNNTLYSQDNPHFYQYVHFVAGGEGVIEDSVISVDETICDDVRVDIVYGTDAFSAQLQSMHINPRRGEDYVDAKVFTRTLDFTSMSYSDMQQLIQHLDNFMHLRICYDYKQEYGGIILYVNYQNYINSPYVKLVDGLTYSTIIDNTYAKILPNESSVVNIVVQFKQCINNVLMGVNDVIVASFRIYNVSDDKPKFVIERTSLI